MCVALLVGAQCHPRTRHGKHLQLSKAPSDHLHHPPLRSLAPLNSPFTLHFSEGGLTGGDSPAKPDDQGTSSGRRLGSWSRSPAALGWQDPRAPLLSSARPPQARSSSATFPSVPRRSGQGHCRSTFVEKQTSINISFGYLFPLLAASEQHLF